MIDCTWAQGVREASARARVPGWRAEALVTIGDALEERGVLVAQHSVRVAGYADHLGQMLSFGSPRAAAELRLAALLHDLGKGVVPRKVLDKPGPLSAGERRIIESHVSASVALLENIGVPEVVTATVRHHHERWDGTGYPDGLKGEEIPLPARILTAADVYDALTSDRAYRGALLPGAALGLMADEGLCDPEVLGALIETVALPVLYVPADLSSVVAA